MRYLCEDKDHHINVCSNCAKHHRVCPFDCAMMTLDSIKDLAAMLKGQYKKPYKK